MKPLVLSFLLALACSGIPSAEEVKENCSSTNACADAIVHFCECCPDKPGGLSCEIAEDLCAGALRLDRRMEPSECRIYAAISCETIQDEGGCD